MELLAVIRAIEYIDKKFDETLLNVYTDSQYVFRIRERKEKLKKNQFCTKKGTPIQNIDLVKKIIHKIETHEIDFKKVKAHQKPEIIGLNIQSGNSVNINIEVDRLARKMMRDGIKRSKNKVPYKIFS
jgi:ribonuclease HI